MRTIVIAIFIAALSALAVQAGESLLPEGTLALHEGEDAYRPVVGFGKDIYLVAWQSGMRRQGDIVACRVDLAGKVLDAKPFVISAAKDDQEMPRVCFGGGNFLVVWQDLRNEKDYDVRAARVSPDGKVLDPEGLLVAGGAHNQAMPKACFDGKSFFVVWQDFRSGKKYEVYGAQVSTDGKLLDGKGLLVAGSDKSYLHRTTPAVASRGDGKSFVVWGGGSGGGYAGNIIRFGGTLVTGGKPQEAFAVRQKEGHLSSPHAGVRMYVAAGPKGYVAVWRSWASVGRSPGPSRNASAYTFGADGKAGKPFFPTGGTRYLMDPDIAWDGSAYVVCWYEQSVRPKVKGQPHDKVRAIRVSQEGKPAGPEHKLAGSFTAPAKAAALATDGKGTTLIAYEQHPKTGTEPIKVAFRIIKAK